MTAETRSATCLRPSGLTCQQVSLKTSKDTLFCQSETLIQFLTVFLQKVHFKTLLVCKVNTTQIGNDLNGETFSLWARWVSEMKRMFTCGDWTISGKNVGKMVHIYVEVMEQVLAVQKRKDSTLIIVCLKLVLEVSKLAAVLFVPL